MVGGMQGSPQFEGSASMEDGGVAQTGGLDSQVALQASAGLGAEGNGDANGGAGRSRANASGFLVRRKRGRPRRYGADGGVVGASSSRSFAPGVSGRRGRGRPRGSSSGHLHAPTGGRPTEVLEGSFNPQAVTVDRGEEILAKLSALIQPETHSLALLSATGAISSAVIRQPWPSNAISSYEGYFQILAMHGSFAICEGRISLHPRLSMVNIMLAGPDGEVFGGGVAGPLIAAGSSQFVVGNFKRNGGNELMGEESTDSHASADISVPASPIHEVRQPEQIARMAEVDDDSGTPTSVLQEPADKEPNTAVTFGNNDVNPPSVRIDEHNSLELVETMLDRNMSTDKL